MMPYSTALNYADDSLRWTMDSGLPDHAKLAWYRDRDIATRTRMMETMRPPLMLSAGEALTQALDYLRNEWRPAHIPLGGGGNSSNRDDNRSRSRGGGGGKGSNRRERTNQNNNTASCLKGGQQLCSAYNSGKCARDERKCPQKKLHKCNFRLPDGTACGKKHNRADNH